MADTGFRAKLPSILAAHAKWVRGEDGGARADLRSADLSGAYLNGADLRSADLRSADLNGANLSGANLSSANLSSADLYGADLRGADLSSADLSGAYLYGADLRGADLSSADLSGAYLRSADLRSADLNGANLSGAKGLAEVKWGSEGLPFGPVTLPDWTFRAYKLARGPNNERVIVTLEIPEDAQRVAPLTGRKCRASKAKVIALSVGESAKSWHQKGGRPVVTYRAGEVVEADKYDPSPFVECSGGIHFLISRREAETYNG